MRTAQSLWKANQPGGDQHLPGADEEGNFEAGAVRPRIHKRRAPERPVQEEPGENAAAQKVHGGVVQLVCHPSEQVKF